MKPKPLAAFLATVVTIFALACARPGSNTQAAPPDGAPAIGGVHWSEAPDTRIPVEAIRWCDDPQGHSAIYPCKWDARERPAPSWDAQLPPIAVWVWRASGCPIHQIKIAEDSSVGWACYYAEGVDGR